MVTRPEAFGRARHLVRLGVVFRQRLFAHDVFARRQQRQRRRMMRAVGRHVGGRVEITFQAIASSSDVKTLGMPCVIGEGFGAQRDRRRPAPTSSTPSIAAKNAGHGCSAMPPVPRMRRRMDGPQR
jgi:hypothetical protein